MLTYRRRLLQNVEKTVRAGWANITDRGVEMSASFSVVTELRVDGTRSQVSPVNIFRRVLSPDFFDHLAWFATVVRGLQQTLNSTSSFPPSRYRKFGIKDGEKFVAVLIEGMARPPALFYNEFIRNKNRMTYTAMTSNAYDIFRKHVI